MKLLWDIEGHLTRFPRDIVAGYNYTVGNKRVYLSQVGTRILDRLSGRLYTGTVSGGSLDDYTYLFRLEAENASRHTVQTAGDISLDGNGWCVFGGIAGRAAVLTSDDFKPYNAAWAVELYFKLDAIGANEWLICSQGEAVGSQFMDIYVDSSGDIHVRDTGLGKTYASALLANTEYHLEFNTSAGVDYLFVNGTRIVGTGSWSGVGFSGYTGIYLGSNSNGTDTLAGAESRLQFTNGVMRHTANFTPPVRTTDITVDANTVLALNFAGDAASTRIIDGAKPAYGVESPAASPFLRDISGNEADIVQAVTTKQGLFDPQTNKISTDGVDDFYANAALVQAQPFTAYMVASVTADTVAQTMFGDTTAYMGLTDAEYFTANAGSAVADTTDHSGSKKLFAVEFNGASSVLYVDGVQVATGDVGAGALSGFGVGADSAGTNPTAMDFYAAFAQAGGYDAALNGLIETKYGL